MSGVVRRAQLVRARFIFNKIRISIRLVQVSLRVRRGYQLLVNPRFIFTNLTSHIVSRTVTRRTAIRMTVLGFYRYKHNIV